MGARTDWVDYAKAVGIVLVVYGHVARGVFNAGIKIPGGMYQLFDGIIYSFHMPLFFFLSGLFFHRSFSKRGGGKFILNKIDVIAYPYFLWSIIQGAVEVVFANYTNGSLALPDVFMLWEPRAQFWFLYALFFVFVFGSIVFSFVSERYVIRALFFALILYLADLGFLGFKPLSFVADSFVYFVFGMVFTRFDFEEVFSTGGAFFASMAAFVMSQYLFHDYLNYSPLSKSVFGFFLAIISILFVVSLSILISRFGNKFIAYIGASSMSIYILHILSGSSVRVVLSAVFGVNDFLVHLILGCLAGVLVPLLVVKFFEFLKFSYAFSAPISKVLEFLYKKASQWVIR